MASKTKPGIKYFSQDVDHVENTKVKLIFIEFDANGPWIWECLKCHSYKKRGYYFDPRNEEELILFASDVCKKPVSLVKEVIKACIRRDLFDKGVFDMYNILTSDRIQNNYLDGTREQRKKGYPIELVKEYLLIEIGKNEKAVNVISLNGEYSREKDEKSREKGGKGDESKRDKRIDFSHEEFFKSVEMFFGFSEISHFKNFQLLTEFCAALHFSGKLEAFKSQFKNYSELKGLTGFKHSYANFLGKQENKFEDGVWNSENWELKLKDELEIRDKKRGKGQQAVDHSDNKKFFGV